MDMRLGDARAEMQEARVQRVEVGGAEQRERDADLVLQQFQQRDAGGAGGRKPVAIQPADGDRVGAERDRLDDVGAAQKPPSTITRARPRTASTTSGSTSIEPRP